MSDLESSHYHSNNPFEITQHRYYLTPELNQRINLIRHLIQNSEQLLLILAEIGCGKTALLTQLMRIIEKHCEDWLFFSITGNETLAKEKFLSEILAVFNVRQHGKPTQVLQESLRNHIVSKRYNNQLPVLFIDDAHKLPLETLKFLIELNMQGEPLTRIRVILFCEPQITSILAAPEFEMVQNTLIHTLDIPPFSKTQVRDYLQFCLQNSKYSNIHPFSSDVIKKIYSDSEGVAGKINQYAKQILRQFSEQRHDPSLPITLPHSKLLWGIPLLLLLIALFVYWKFNQLFESKSSVNNQPTFLHAPIMPDSNGILPDNSITQPFAMDLTTNAEASNQDGLNLSEQDNDNFPSTERDDFISTDLLGQTNIKGEKWLRNQNPNAYTVQILGVHEPLTLKQFIAKYDFDNLGMFKTSYRNRNWYVLVYGIYPTRAQAKTALKKLPAKLRENNQPWIRSLASVQRLIQ